MDKMFGRLHKDMSKMGKGIDSIIDETIAVDTSKMSDEHKAMIEKLQNSLPGIKERMMKSDNPMDVYKEIEKEWLSNL